jgi:Uma2 family endonuclease
MMPASRKITYAEYLALEEASVDVKHELIAGEVVAMSGGSPEHGALAMAFGALLQNALRGRPCRVFSSDVRVRVAATGLAAYPDVSVVCGKLETDAEDVNALTNPVLLVEVLSDSTEARDRGVKAAHYRHIPSLREYVLVSQREPHVEVHRRNEAGRWELFEYESGGQAELASVGCTIAVDDLYRDPLAGPTSNGPP